MIWFFALAACTIAPHVPTPPSDSDGPPSSATVPPTQETGSPPDTANDVPPPPSADADGDGYSAPFDCDDADPDIHPHATEIVADGVDQNCDGLELCYRDVDNDGFGTLPTDSADLTCTGAGFSAQDGDCDDTLSQTYPGAPDPPGDGVDQDCDGSP